jgi:hypothetical protein
MSISVSREEKFNKGWIKKILDDYGNDIIKYDVDKTNELYNFISQNLKHFAKSIKIMANDYFILSCFIYTFSWKLNNSYRAIKDGLLYENSANCKFTFGNIDGKKTFIKVVDTINTGADYIIMDIMNCILLEILYEKTKQDMRTPYYNTPDIFTNYSLTDFVNKFDASFSSYSTPTHWNYNKLMDEKYIYSNFCQITPTPSYTKKSHIYMTNAINGKPQTLRTLFEAYTQDQTVITIINKYFNSLKHIYNYIYYMGFHFGFLHNDLHQGNLLFDTYIEKLTMIDYGRNYIGYFYDNRNKYIDDCVRNYHTILNYKNINGETQIPTTYRKMINMYQNQYALRSVIKSTYNDGYMTHILDIITLSLSCLYYIDLIKHFDHINSGVGGNIQYDANFLRLTNLVYFAKAQGHNEYQDLINKNLIISLTTSPIDEATIINTYISTKKDIIADIANGTDFEYSAFIYDGLFYTALLLNYFNLDGDDISPRNGGEIFYKVFQIVKNSSLINQIEINKFMKHLNYINSTYKNLSNINIYFKKMRNNKTSISALSRIRGGKMNVDFTISKITTTKDKKKMQEVINRLERNDTRPIEPPFDIKETDEEIMQAYEKIFLFNNK